MSAFGTVGLVAQREIRQRFRGKAFWIFTAVLCVAVVGAGLLNKAVSGDDETTYHVAVTAGGPPELRAALPEVAAAFDARVRIIDTDPAQLAATVTDGPADAGIDAGVGRVVFDGDVPDELARLLDAAWASARAAQAAEAAGLSEAQTAEILQPAPLQRDVLDPDDDDGVGRTVGTISGILLFLSINFLGGAVLTGVVEEKTTAVVEVLLARVRAHQLLAGKVAGITVVGLVQFAAAVAAGAVALSISGVSVPDEVWVSLPSMIFWFLGGFVLYATLFALGGSFVSRQEDAQSAVMPISTFLTIAYVLMFAFSADPGSAASRVVSVLPPFAPLLMPLRVATGSASVLEIVLAAALLVGAVLALLRLAGRIYAHTLLHRGARLRWREALRAAGTD